MSDKLVKDSGESTVSRYTQQKVATAEGSTGRSAVGPSLPKTLPDEDFVVYDSAGGSIDEKIIPPSEGPNLRAQRRAGEYGKVKVIKETQAGHVILLDETPGNERIFILHPNGTYTNIEPTQKIDKIEGEYLTLVSQGWQIEVKNDRIAFIHGNETITIDKNREITITGNNTESVTGNEDITVTGNRTKSVTGTEDETVTGAKTDTFKDDWTINVDGNVTLTCKKDVTVTAKTINLN